LDSRPSRRTTVVSMQIMLHICDASNQIGTAAASLP
jgi:hypothetical protein